MRKKKSVSAILIMAILVLILTVSPVRAKDTGLPLVSGSDCDPTTFEYREHTIAEGFAVDISADLPFETLTQIKFGGAVAGLGDSWEERGLGYAHEYNPYVEEMWVKVEGDSHYTAAEIAIYDNTGTGESSCGLFEAVLTGIGIVFNAYQIYQWLAEVYQEPLVAEWQDNGHWSKAISRQGGWSKPPPTYVPYLNPNKPHLQTASANVWGYIEAEGLQTWRLTITAGAKIYVQWHDLIYGGVVQTYIGTYSVSYVASFWFGSLPPWDINEDRECNILDLSAVARSLGTNDEYPWGTGWDEYNPDADMNGDRQIDIDDLTTVANHYGEEY